MSARRLSPVLSCILAAFISPRLSSEENRPEHHFFSGALREAFPFRGEPKLAESLPPLFMAKPTSSTEPAHEIVHLPLLIVRERPDHTKRDVDDSIAVQKRLDSGALGRKDLTKSIRAEALLPPWLDTNYAGEKVLRFDLLKFGW